MRKYDTVFGIVMIVISAYLITIALEFTSKQARGGNSGDPGASFWPIILCSGLILCSVILLVRTAIRAKKATEPEAALIDYKSAGVHCVFKIFGVMILYAVLLYYIGFIASTPVFVVAVMLAMGERRVKWIGLTAGGITAFIYVAFALIMHVVLPRGVLF